MVFNQRTTTRKSLKKRITDIDNSSPVIKLYKGLKLIYKVLKVAILIYKILCVYIP